MNVQRLSKLITHLELFSSYTSATKFDFLHMQINCDLKIQRHVSKQSMRLNIFPCGRLCNQSSHTHQGARREKWHVWSMQSHAFCVRSVGDKQKTEVQVERGELCGSRAEKQPRGGGGPGIYGGQQVWMEALQEFVHERERKKLLLPPTGRFTLINCWCSCTEKNVHLAGRAAGKCTCKEQIK